MAANDALTKGPLAGGGEMGVLTRQYDWATSALGTPDQWPPSLMTMLGMILHTSVPMLLWWGPDLIQFYNDACRPTLTPTGKHPTALGQRGAACWPDNWSILKALIDQALAGGESIRDDAQPLPMQRSGQDGNIYRTFTYSPVWGENDRVAGVLAVGHARAQVPTVQQNQECFRFTTQFSQFGAWEVDLTTGIVHGDDRFDELFYQSSSRSELHVQSQQSRVHPDDVARVSQATELAMQPQSDGLYDITHRLTGHTDGKTLWGRFTGRAYFNADGTPYSFKGIAQNVTKEIEAQQQIEASEALLQRVFKHTAVGIFITHGISQIIEMANPAWCALINLREDQLVGKSFFDLPPEVNKALVKNTVADVMQTGQPFIGKEQLTNLDHQGQSKTMYLDVVIEPLPETDGRVNRIVHTITDVTERVLARQLVEQHLVREQELNELKSNFVTLASHEFRTPMTTILSSASLIGRYNGADDGDKRNRHLQRIESAVDGLTSLLDDFLSLSLTEQETLYNHPYPLHIGLFCEELIEDIRGMLKPGQHVVYRHLAGELAVLIDGQLLRNILINLLINSSKYSADAKEIELTTIVQANQLQITVKDEGIGIPDAEKHRLFVDFFRASNVTHIQGTGLGLYIVKRYVELLGGHITFISQLDLGTIFTVQLPLSPLSLPA